MAKFEVTVQVWKENHALIKTTQGEAGSKMVDVTFLDASGQPIDLTGCIPRMYVFQLASTPLNDGAILDAEGGIAEFVITADMTAAAGDFPCGFLLVGSNYPPLKPDGLTLHVTTSTLESVIYNSNEWGALERALASLEQLKKEVADVTAIAQQTTANAQKAVDDANKANLTATEAAQKAGGAADTAEKAAQDALNSHSMISPVTHYLEPIEKIINDLFATMSALGGGAPTAAEYAALGLTAEQYAAKGLNAAQYAMAGKSLLGG